MAFGYGCENLSKYEEQGLGIQWSNIAQSPEEGTRYSFLVSILMMLLDALLYWTLTCYIENVFPGNGPRTLLLDTPSSNRATGW